MKKLILAAAAASVLAAAPAAAAPGFGQNDRGRVEQVQRGKQVTVVRNNGRQVVKTKQVVKSRQVQARKWRKGERFDSRHAGNYRVIQNPRAYGLRDAPRGYRYVQSGNDAVLVAITSGIIGAILGNAF
jgi:Ni/Co efflux regulator RcnB